MTYYKYHHLSMVNLIHTADCNLENTFYYPNVELISREFKKGSENRDLVICNSCSWAVSLLKGSKPYHHCPICKCKKLEVIPVEDYEGYKVSMSRKSGLSIEFAGHA